MIQNHETLPYRIGLQKRIRSKSTGVVAVLTLLYGATVGLQADVSYDFSISDHGWTPAVENGSSVSPFTWDNAAGVGGVGAWFIDGVGSTSIKTLTSPLLTVAGSGPVTVTIRHRFDFEYFGTPPLGDAFDGGQLRYRVNSGSWTLVESSDFTTTGYVGDLDGIDGLGLLSTGWSSRSTGYSTPSYVMSEASFGSFSAGNTLEFQLRGGWDSAIVASAPNWVIGEIVLTNVPEPSMYGGLAGLALLIFGSIRRLHRPR